MPGIDKSIEAESRPGLGEAERLLIGMRSPFGGMKML